MVRFLVCDSTQGKVPWQSLAISGNIWQSHGCMRAVFSLYFTKRFGWCYTPGIWIGWWRTIYRKARRLDWMMKTEQKTLVSCRFSLESVHCYTCACTHNHILHTDAIIAWKCLLTHSLARTTLSRLLLGHVTSNPTRATWEANSKRSIFSPRDFRSVNRWNGHFGDHIFFWGVILVQAPWNWAIWLVPCHSPESFMGYSCFFFVSHESSRSTLQMESREWDSDSDMYI